MKLSAALPTATRHRPLALFPISPSRVLFSTERVELALAELPFLKDVRLTVLIADRFQAYNAAMGIARHAEENRDHRASVKRLLKERQAWLQSVVKTPSIARRLSSDVSIIGVDEIAGKVAYRTLRNLRILFASDSAFRQDLLSVAKNFLSSRKNHNNIVLNTDLSIDYLLDEFACNLAFRVCRGVSIECYVGAFHLPHLRLFDGFYSKNVFELTECRSSRGEFEFWVFEPDGRSWRQIR